MWGSSVCGTANFCDPPLLIFAATEASILKFIIQLVFGKWHAKTTFGTKIGGGPGQGAPQKIWDPLFLQQLKLWTSNLVYKFGSWSSVAKNNFQDQNQWGLGWGALLQILGPPTYFCNNFSQGLQIWYITWGHGVVLPKTTFRTKIAGFWARGAAPKFWNLLVICTPAEDSNFKFGTQLSVTEQVALLKTTFRANTDRGMGQGAPQKFWGLYLFLQTLKVATSNLVYNLGCENMIQKLLLRPKMAWVWAREHPTNVGCFVAHTYANFSPESCFWHAIRQTRVVYLI